MDLGGGRLFVVASAMGSPRHPDWYHNVVAHPGVTVEIGDERFPAEAVPASEEEYEELFAQALEQWPFLADHRERAERRLPLVELRPLPDPAAGDA
ncbi:nitroreductase family deazaflavin-dependent oxidoreductase [Streptomyces sp. P38-E01]|uniref:Nitroreductase family deazaflavin-dependent oxidoreductase n=1 Tax=Streptomyces tardus TaxID=2780544 RepID=A0A949JI87_9ACTN|nr:nitroreductase/quinone reductase family protein [Streptomyces tardus]MBU7599084.1 nitroreductase family deazaflavin-dependent oxidoreductase [Streptomyces tardus]